MKLSRLLFLLPAVSTVVADLAPNPVIPTQSALAQRDVTNANGEVVGASKAGSKGTLDAPVDGYAGNKETEQGKPVKGREKFDATVSSAEGAKKSNNGVTGAEKDMSEKQLGEKKVPEGPKEAPPLPYSEQKKALEESAGGKGTKGVPAVLLAFLLWVIRANRYRNPALLRKPTTSRPRNPQHRQKIRTRARKAHLRRASWNWMNNQLRILCTRSSFLSQ